MIRKGSGSSRLGGRERALHPALRAGSLHEPPSAVLVLATSDLRYVVRPGLGTHSEHNERLVERPF